MTGPVEHRNNNLSRTEDGRETLEVGVFVMGVIRDPTRNETSLRLMVATTVTTTDLRIQK